MAGEEMVFDADAGKYLAEIEKIKTAKASLRGEIATLTKAAVGGSAEAQAALEQQTLAVFKLNQAMDGQKQKLQELTQQQKAFQAQAAETAKSGMNMAALGSFSGTSGGPNMVEQMTNWQLANKRAAGSIDETAQSQRRMNTLMVQGAAIIDDFSSQALNGQLGPALRACTNNISFMASQFSGQAAIIATVAAVTGSILIPKIWDYIHGGEAAAKATAKQAEEFGKLKEKIHDANLELLTLERTEDERDESKRTLKFREEEGSLQKKLDDAIVNAELRAAGEKLILGGFPGERSIATLRRQRAAVQDGNMSKEFKAQALEELNKYLKPVDEAERDLENLRSVDERNKEIRADDLKKRKAKTAAGKSFGQIDAGLRAHAKGMLGQGMMIGDIRDKLKQDLAGHPMLNDPTFQEKIDELIHGVGDEESAKDFEQQFNPKTMTEDEHRLHGLQAQKADIEAQRATKRAAMMGPRGTLTQGQQHQEQREFGQSLGKLTAEIEAASARIAATKFDEEEQAKVIIKTGRPAPLAN